MRLLISLSILSLIAGCGKSPLEQSELGQKYAKGDGVPEVDIDSFKGLRLAAEQGNADAQNNLGLMYHHGAGVPADDVLAYAWLNIAQAAGYEDAGTAKEQTRLGMTKEQIAEAQELSIELMRKIEANTSE